MSAGVRNSHPAGSEWSGECSQRSGQDTWGEAGGDDIISGGCGGGPLGAGGTPCLHRGRLEPDRHGNIPPLPQARPHCSNSFSIVRTVEAFKIVHICPFLPHIKWKILSVDTLMGLCAGARCWQSRRHTSSVRSRRVGAWSPFCPLWSRDRPQVCTSSAQLLCCNLLGGIISCSSWGITQRQKITGG